MSPLLVSGLVGAVAPPGPPNGGGYGGHYLLETPEGGPGRRSLSQKRRDST